LAVLQLTWLHVKRKKTVSKKCFKHFTNAAHGLEWRWDYEVIARE